MILPSFLALNADHRSIGGFHVGLSIQGYPHGKASRPIVSNDLNAGDGLAAGPLLYSLEALFSQSRVVEADCTVMKAHHAGIRIFGAIGEHPPIDSNARVNRKHGGSYPANYRCSAHLRARVLLLQTLSCAGAKVVHSLSYRGHHWTVNARRRMGRHGRP
jgi:hypothetical protein